MANLKPSHSNNLDKKCKINLHGGIYMPNQDVINLGELAGQSSILEQTLQVQTKNNLQKTRGIMQPLSQLL